MTGRDHVLSGGVSRQWQVYVDYTLLIGLTLLLIATGVGLRDPWPADEPRFALIARDMVATGDWLIPRVGGDVYADKPPLFFWLVGGVLWVTGSLRFAFLFPSVASALGCAILIYDLAKRCWGRGTALRGAVALILTVQFVWQARQAQIDATLCFWTTLSFYGLLRHLLAGPHWVWYAVGWAAAGLGVITKGVGFLPLLVLPIFAVLRARGWPSSVPAAGWSKWLIGPLALGLAVAIWLVPMLVAAQNDPALKAYRDEILFRQTLDRYANAWHHREPIWFFMTNVIPWLWLPLTALLPWLVPQWKSALEKRDMRIGVALAWIALVVMFFSVSSGKRGVYVLPAVPAFAFACAPYLGHVLKVHAAQRVLYLLGAGLSAILTLAAVYLLFSPGERSNVLAEQGIDPVAPLVAAGVGGAAICALARSSRGALAFAGCMAYLLLLVSFWINPAINDVRSGRAFVQRIEDAADSTADLGLFAFKEQYLLNMTRPVVHFGHARWQEREAEIRDAAAWLAAAPNRQLVVNEWGRARCFSRAMADFLGVANREEWFLVRSSGDRACSSRGRADAAIRYGSRPPRLVHDHRD